MKLTNTCSALSALGLCTLAVLGSSAALADEQPGWYLGGSAGRARATLDDARINANLLGAGFSSSVIADRDIDTAYKLYGGYQFNRNFALEAGYFDLGSFGYLATTVPAGTLSGDIKLKGLNLDLVGTLPLSERFSAFGRIGVTSVQADDRFMGTGAVRVTNASPSERATNMKLGLGLQYAISDAWQVRAELERYRVNDAVGNRGDIDYASIGLVYRFGAKPAPRMAQTSLPAQPYVVAAAPAPIVMAPPPPPAPPPASPPALPPPTPRIEPKRVTFAADSLFDFDKSTIKPEGMQALNEFAAATRGTNFDVIKVTGHTDRLGPHAYNLALSTRRAQSVASYFTQTAGIPGNKISATGVNGERPITKPGECKGNKQTKALIACLQPDRRVEIEVSGTR